MTLGNIDLFSRSVVSSGVQIHDQGSGDDDDNDNDDNDHDDVRRECADPLPPPRPGGGSPDQ